MFQRKPRNLVMDLNVIKPGDMIGFSGRSWISAGVNIATYGIPLLGISHVGIMANTPDGRLLIFESTTLEDLPCEISGENFTGTQAHKLEDILRVEIKSLRDEVAIAQMLVEERLNKIKTDQDLFTACGSINALLLTIEKLVSRSYILEQILGQLYHKSTIIQMMQAFVEIVDEEVRSL